VGPAHSEPRSAELEAKNGKRARNGRAQDLAPAKIHVSTIAIRSNVKLQSCRVGGCRCSQAPAGSAGVWAVPGE
jgi:hypothetical protein